MRGLILAFAFLTRLPMPALRDFRAEEQARCIVWFPLVGLVVGSAVGIALWSGARVDPWLGALLGLAAWVWITGGLHLDGLADLADALGAAHRDRERLLAVLADPHLGAFGAIALFLQLAAKLVLLMLVAKTGGWWSLPLAAAWGRWGVFVWTRLPSIKPGLGETYAWRAGPGIALVWGGALAAASWAIAPMLLLAPVAVAGWYLWLKRHLGGMTGDALGAGIEWTETLLLVALIL